MCGRRARGVVTLIALTSAAMRNSGDGWTLFISKNIHRIDNKHNSLVSATSLICFVEQEATTQHCQIPNLTLDKPVLTALASFLRVR